MHQENFSLALKNVSLPKGPNAGTGFLQAWSMTQTCLWFRANWKMISIICFYFLAGLNLSGSWIIVGHSRLKYSIKLHLCLGLIYFRKSL